MTMEFNYIWLIVLFPFIGALLTRLFGGWLIPRKGVHLLSCAAVFASFVLSLVSFIKLRALMGAFEGEAAGIPKLINALFPWIQAGELTVWVRFVVDPLSSVMILVVSGVGFLIHVYSTGYMAHDEEYPRYFSYLNLFTAMMLVLVLGDSLLLMFIGWEGVGLCSYLLIGFWFKDKSNADAGKKAFIVNRIGDFGFMVGILALFWTMGKTTGVWTFDFSAVSDNIGQIAKSEIFGVGIITFVGIMLFVGATGKSAQIPLYVWLPDAMAGPTPVSALIHAATMVTSGVYMICRLNFLYDLSPVAMGTVAWTGAITAVFAATIGLFQNDIKKVLAYSTVSQLGYMFLAVGVGAYSAGLFHLTTHAFFKGLLFLGAGSVIHAMSNKMDMRDYGGLRKYLPYTFWTFMAGYLAICGIFPFAGFFSKDEILWKAANNNIMLWVIGIFTAALTAFYMTRLMMMTFFGKERFEGIGPSRPHESPKNMTVPLFVLAVLAVMGGWVGWPHFLGGHNHFHHYTSAVFGVMKADRLSHSLEYVLMAASLFAAIAGIFTASLLYGKRGGIPKRLKERYKRAYDFAYNKYYVDELYHAVFVKGTIALARFSAMFDRYVIDGAVNGAGWLLKIIVHIDGTIDRYVVDGAVNGLADLTVALGKGARKIQTGRLYNYLLIAIIGFLGIFATVYFF